ncbi:hypothetical protein BDC45DRAFT_538387 [Circinella umbellata]|nr:hypothetical protein BDC45DRAFT_538387 [Circinella umbellata]
MEPKTTQKLPKTTQKCLKKVTRIINKSKGCAIERAKNPNVHEETTEYVEYVSTLGQKIIPCENDDLKRVKKWLQGNSYHDNRKKLDLDLTPELFVFFVARAYPTS